MSAIPSAMTGDAKSTLPRRGRVRARAALPLLVLILASAARADEANVVAVEVHAEAGGTYRFDVTVQHADEGWKHYADRWEVMDPGGRVLATRVLHHPHVEEQPFTRSLGGVHVPDGVERVLVRARDSVHGYGGRTREAELPRAPAPASGASEPGP